MKKWIGSIVGLGILLAAASAYAEIEQTVQVKVAFPFVAGGKIFPAADYRIHIVQPTGLVTLTTPGIQSVTMLTNKNERLEGTSDATYLVFERHGENWVLGEVTYDGTAQVFHTGKLPKELQMPQPSVSTAGMTASASGN